MGITQTPHSSGHVLRISQQQVSVSQEQVRVAQEEFVNQVRPVVVPVGIPIFQPEHDNWLKWDENVQPLSLRNLGTGSTFNVASVLYGCASYLHPDMTGNYSRSTASAREHWACWLGAPIPPGETEAGHYLRGNGTFNEGNNQIGGYSFNAPDEEIPGRTSLMGDLWRIARVTITYHDIAGRKYASIFDFIHNRGWHMVEVLSLIDRDLHDMEGYYRPAQTSSPDVANAAEDALSGSE